MKKVFFILFFFAAFTSSSQDFGSLFSLGLNSCQINGDDMSGFNKTGLNIGFAVNRKFSQRWNTELGFHYTAKGSRKTYDENGIGSGYWDLAKLRYMEVSITEHYGLKSMKNKWSVHAGLAGAYLISSIVYSGNNIAPDPFNKKEWSYHVGAAYQITPKVQLQSRLGQSLFSTANGNHRAVFQNRSGFINLWLSFNVRFRLGR